MSKVPDGQSHGQSHGQSLQTRLAFWLRLVLVVPIVPKGQSLNQNPTLVQAYGQSHCPLGTVPRVSLDQDATLALRLGTVRTVRTVLPARTPTTLESGG